jgi:TonB family protein
MFCKNCGATLQPFNQFCPTCGVPVASQAAPPPQPPPFQGNAAPPPMWTPAMNQGAPQKSSSGCGKILLIIGILGILLVGAIGGLIYYGYRKAESALKNSDAYKVALSSLKESAEAKDKLGEIKDTGFPLGSFNEETGGTGNAAFTMSVTGTKTSGRYNVVMRRTHSVWQVLRGSVTLNGGETVNVVNSNDEDTNLQNANTNEGSNANWSASNNNSTRRGVGGPEHGAIAGGVLDSKVISKPEPNYPQVAKAVHASGLVKVRVVVDETGKVISAQAISGHPLLQSAAVEAAKQARLAPVILSGQPVKVDGTLTYNFAAQ